jgi:hypothetical protein
MFDCVMPIGFLRWLAFFPHNDVLVSSDREFTSGWVVAKAVREFHSSRFRGVRVLKEHKYLDPGHELFG